MATWDDVRRIAVALPEVTERPSYDQRPAWRVKDKAFAWDRPLRKSDLAALGPTAPDGPVLAASVPDLGAKEALLADDPTVYFTTPHFDGYSAILVRLAEIDPDELAELLTEAWLTRAPKRLAQQYEADH
ncbi:MmcQ/YjbR family DNA-binding protein [Actinosynnema sp. NPDC023794]